MHEEAEPREDARYEYRIWGRDLSTLLDRLHTGWEKSDVRSTREVYLLSREQDEYSAKIRRGSLDVKRLIGNCSLLERWQPWREAEFPVSTEWWSSKVAPLLACDAPDAGEDELPVADFLKQIAEPSDDLVCVPVVKRKHSFTDGRCLAEYTEVTLLAGLFNTVAVESEDPAECMRAAGHLGLIDHLNLNYAAALRRILRAEPATLNSEAELQRMFDSGGPQPVIPATPAPYE